MRFRSDVSSFCTAFSDNLKRMGSSVTGRKWVGTVGSPDLKSRVTGASLKADGTVPQDSEALNRAAIDGVTMSALHFRSTPGMPSLPVALVPLMLLSSH